MNGSRRVTVYFNPLLSLFERAFREGFIDESGRGLYRVTRTAEEAVRAIEES